MEPTISKEAIIELATKLKSNSKEWASLMATEISSTKEWRNYSNQPLTVENCRKISDGTIKGNSHRRMFVECGIKLLSEFEKQAEKDLELAHKLKKSLNHTVKDE